MANVDFPHGLRPLGICLSGSPAVLLQELAKAVGLATAICVFDAVARLADGSISSRAADITPGTTLYSGVALNYGAASLATNHTVIVSPDAIFEAQGDDGAAGTLDAADMGLNCNLLLTAGDTTTKLSKHEIDASEKDVTNSLDVKLLGLLNVPDNAYGAQARIEIAFNKHRMAPGVAGL
jgi:hypothetical protein